MLKIFFLNSPFLLYFVVGACYFPPQVSINVTHSVSAPNIFTFNRFSAGFGPAATAEV